ncbi:MAG: hypothetical protein HYS65_04365, partial [Betaproteobacteria bacterium]|nr:hypothetical protein [Betaproteobacteria bacterium]
MESRVDPIALPQQLHIGVVVKDMDRTIQLLSSTFGIGPWDIKERRYPEACEAFLREIGINPFGGSKPYLAVAYAALA